MNLIWSSPIKLSLLKSDLLFIFNSKNNKQMVLNCCHDLKDNLSSRKCRLLNVSLVSFYLWLFRSGFVVWEQQERWRCGESLGPTVVWSECFSRYVAAPTSWSILLLAQTHAFVTDQSDWWATFNTRGGCVLVARCWYARCTSYTAILSEKIVSFTLLISAV